MEKGQERVTRSDGGGKGVGEDHGVWRREEGQEMGTESDRGEKKGKSNDHEV